MFGYKYSSKYLVSCFTEETHTFFYRIVSFCCLSLQLKCWLHTAEKIHKTCKWSYLTVNVQMRWCAPTTVTLTFIFHESVCNGAESYCLTAQHRLYILSMTTIWMQVYNIWEIKNYLKVLVKLQWPKLWDNEKDKVIMIVLQLYL